MSPIPADIYAFMAPHTYTGQDVIEIHTISCPPILDVLIAQCLDAGQGGPAGRVYDAHLLGRQARSDPGGGRARRHRCHRPQRAQARPGTTGRRPGEPTAQLREDLLNLLADVEAGLDFAEEDIQFISTEVLLKHIAKGLAYLTLMRKQIEQRLARPTALPRGARRQAECGQEQAVQRATRQGGGDVVSAEPGTTRDYLEKPIELDGVTFHLVDTAGEGASLDTIDASAQQLGREQSQQADVVLWCHACRDDPLDAEPPPEAMCIATKADLAKAATGLATSAVTGVGVDELRRELSHRVRSTGHAALAPSLSRCRHHVDTCLANLRQAHALVLDEQMPELLAWNCD